MKWEIRKLMECTEYITDGDHQPAPKSNTGVLFIKIKDIHGGNIDFNDALYVPDEYYSALPNDRKPQYGDTLYTVVGSYGISAFVRSETKFCFERNIALLHPNPKINPLFLYYAVNTPSFYYQATNGAIGTAQKLISLSRLKQFTIQVPPHSIQNQIADILYTYDRLIDNNQKQIKLLEEAAQRLYKEWFVDLRFPGYEKVAVVDGVPEGWERNRADSFFSISIGKTPPRAEKQWFVSGSDGVPWLSISDMGSADAFALVTNEALTEEAVNKFHVKVVPPGTIFVSFKLTVGRVAIATTDMCTNEAIAHFGIKDDAARAYTYCYLCNFKYDTLGSTSSISKAVNSKIIKSMPFVMPSREVVLSFSKQVNPILNTIKNKQLDCIKLKEARDRLLPKLMSGELEV